MQYPSMIKLSRFAWDCLSFKTENPAVHKPLSPRKQLSLGQTLCPGLTRILTDVTVSFDVDDWPLLKKSCMGSKSTVGSFSSPHLCCSTEGWILPHQCHIKSSHLARQEKHIKY